MNTKLMIAAASATIVVTLGAGAIGYSLAVSLQAPPSVPYGLMSPQKQTAFRKKGN